MDKYKNKTKNTIKISRTVACISLKTFCTFVAYCAVWKTGDEHRLVWRECWSNTWLSELLRLLAEWCDSQGWAWVQWWTTWLVGEHWSEEHGGKETLCLLPILKSCSTRNWHRKPFKSGFMKMSIDEFPFFVVVIFFLFWVSRWILWQ